MSKIAAVVLVLVTLLSGCNDPAVTPDNPHACNPGDIDRDHDGLCHEK